ncbi:unnamed protein product, partial [Brassica oleracea var. botrytis]
PPRSLSSSPDEFSKNLRHKERDMPHRTRPLTGLLLFTGINAVLVQTITPVYDFVCFLPYWERRVKLGSYNIKLHEASFQFTQRLKLYKQLQKV